jgi:hypothetical protein
MKPTVRSIGRYVEAFSLPIADGEAITRSADMSIFSGGYVHIPTSWTAANLGFQVSDDDSTFIILRDEAGAPVQISGIKTDGARAYALPAEVFGCKHVKLWSKSSTAATETDTNQSGAITLTLVLKS